MVEVEESFVESHFVDGVKHFFLADIECPLFEKFDEPAQKKELFVSPSEIKKKEISQLVGHGLQELSSADVRGGRALDNCRRGQAQATAKQRRQQQMKKKKNCRGTCLEGIERPARVKR